MPFRAQRSLEASSNQALNLRTGPWLVVHPALLTLALEFVLNLILSREPADARYKSGECCSPRA